VYINQLNPVFVTPSNLSQVVSFVTCVYDMPYLNLTETPTVLERAFLAFLRLSRQMRHFLPPATKFIIQTSS